MDWLNESLVEEFLWYGGRRTGGFDRMSVAVFPDPADSRHFNSAVRLEVHTCLDLMCHDGNGFDTWLFQSGVVQNGYSWFLNYCFAHARLDGDKVSARSPSIAVSESRRRIE